MSNKWYPKSNPRKTKANCTVLVTSRRELRIGKETVMSGTPMQLMYFQAEKNEMITVKHNGKCHVFDPIDFDIPVTAQQYDQRQRLRGEDQEALQTEVKEPDEVLR